MTLLNHIGVFILLLIIFYLVSIFEDKDVTFENLLLSFGIAGFVMVFFEAFYWTITVFF